MASRVLNGEEVHGTETAIHVLMSRRDSDLRQLALENPDLISNLQIALNSAFGTNLDVDGQATLAENRNGVDTRLSDTQTVITRAVREFAPNLNPDQTPDLTAFVTQLTETAQQQPAATPVKETIDSREAVQALTDDLRSLSAEDARQLQASLNVIMGANLKEDGFLTRKDGALSQSQTVAAQFIKTYRPDLSTQELTLSDLKGAVAAEHAKLAAPAIAPQVNTEAPVLSAPKIEQSTLDTPAPLTAPALTQSFNAPPLPSTPDPAPSLPPRPLAASFEQTTRPPEVTSPAEPARNSALTALEQRAEAVEWTNADIALVNEIALHVHEHFSEESDTIEAAINAGHYASALHLSINAMQPYVEDGSYDRFFDSIYTNGETPEQAAAQFGDGAKLLFQAEEKLISKNLFNMGGDVIMKDQSGQQLSEVTTPAANAFRTALIAPEEIAPYVNYNIAANELNAPQFSAA